MASRKLKRKIWILSLATTMISIGIMMYIPTLYFQVLPILIPSSIITVIMPTYFLEPSKSTNKENETKLKEVFGYVPQMGEFIETIMNEGCPAYVKKETISPKEASSLIHKAGGKVILAHPVAYSYEDNLTEEDIEKLVMEMQPDGIETNYIYIDRNDIKHNDIVRWNDFAKKHNLKTTIGSDFHKKDGIHPIIGLVGEDIALTEDEIKQMINFLLHN